MDRRGKAWRRRLGRIGASVGMMLAAALITGSVASAQTVSADMFGVAGGWNEPTSPDGPTLTALRGEGVTIMRVDAPWASAAPIAPAGGASSAFDWSGFDAIAATLATAGIRWYPILDSPPSWADTATSPDSVWGAPSDSAFAAYAAAFAARYGAGGSFWTSHPELPSLPVQEFEIWNEENTPMFWPGGADPGEFFGLYSAARAAIHEVQPNATVVFGGLLDSGTDALSWVRQLVREVPGALSQIDALGYHPYLYSASSIENRVAQLRGILDADGARSLPIEVNEFDSNSAFDTPQTWASSLATVVRDLATSNCGITRIMPFNIEATGGADSDGWYAVFSPAGNATAVGSAYFQAIRAVEATTTTNYLCPRLRPPHSAKRREHGRRGPSVRATRRHSLPGDGRPGRHAKAGQPALSVAPPVSLPL